MTEIVRQRQRLGEVLIEPQPPCERAGDLCDLERVSEPGAIMVALVEDENLGLVLETAEGGGMDDPVAIATKRATAFARWLGVQPAAASFRIASIGRAKIGQIHLVCTHFGRQLTFGSPALNYRSVSVAIGRIAIRRANDGQCYCD